MQDWGDWKESKGCWQNDEKTIKWETQKIEKGKNKQRMNKKSKTVEEQVQDGLTGENKSSGDSSVSSSSSRSSSDSSSWSSGVSSFE
jgi:hypothetical protein